MRDSLTFTRLQAYPALRMAIVSSGFALLLSAAVLSGSFMARQQVHQPSLAQELRQLRGVSTIDLDEQGAAPDEGSRDATVLASQAAEQNREMLEMKGLQATTTTHHHERGSI